MEKKTNGTERFEMNNYLDKLKEYCEKTMHPGTKPGYFINDYDPEKAGKSEGTIRVFGTTYYDHAYEKTDPRYKGKIGDLIARRNGGKDFRDPSTRKTVEETLVKYFGAELSKMEPTWNKKAYIRTSEEQNILADGKFTRPEYEVLFCRQWKNVQETMADNIRKTGTLFGRKMSGFPEIYVGKSAPVKAEDMDIAPLLDRNSVSFYRPMTSQNYVIEAMTGGMHRDGRYFGMTSVFDEDNHLFRKKDAKAVIQSYTDHQTWANSKNRLMLYNMEDLRKGGTAMPESIRPVVKNYKEIPAMLGKISARTGKDEEVAVKRFENNFGRQLRKEMEEIYDERVRESDQKAIEEGRKPIRYAGKAGRALAVELATAYVLHSVGYRSGVTIPEENRELIASYLEKDIRNENTPAMKKDGKTPDTFDLTPAELELKIKQDMTEDEKAVLEAGQKDNGKETGKYDPIPKTVFDAKTLANRGKLISACIEMRKLSEAFMSKKREYSRYLEENRDAIMDRYRSSAGKAKPEEHFEGLQVRMLNSVKFSGQDTIPEGMTFKGEEAYLLLAKMMNEDKKSFNDRTREGFGQTVAFRMEYPGEGNNSRNVSKRMCFTIGRLDGGNTDNVGDFMKNLDIKQTRDNLYNILDKDKALRKWKSILVSLARKRGNQSMENELSSKEKTMLVKWAAYINKTLNKEYEEARIGAVTALSGFRKAERRYLEEEPHEHIRSTVREQADTYRYKVDMKDKDIVMTAFQAKNLVSDPERLADGTFRVELREPLVPASKDGKMYYAVPQDDKDVRYTSYGITDYKPSVSMHAVPDLDKKARNAAENFDDGFAIVVTKYEFVQGKFVGSTETYIGQDAAGYLAEKMNEDREEFSKEKSGVRSTKNVNYLIEAEYNGKPLFKHNHVVGDMSAGRFDGVSGYLEDRMAREMAGMEKKIESAKTNGDDLKTELEDYRRDAGEITLGQRTLEKYPSFRKVEQLNLIADGKKEEDGRDYAKEIREDSEKMMKERKRFVNYADKSIRETLAKTFRPDTYYKKWGNSNVLLDGRKQAVKEYESRAVYYVDKALANGKTTQKDQTDFLVKDMVATYGSEKYVRTMFSMNALKHLEERADAILRTPEMKESIRKRHEEILREKKERTASIRPRKTASRGKSEAMAR